MIFLKFYTNIYLYIVWDFVSVQAEWVPFKAIEASRLNKDTVETFIKAIALKQNKTSNFFFWSLIFVSVWVSSEK